MQPPSTWAGADPAAGPVQETPQAIEFIWGVKIPMRDGVRLNATVYKPKDPAPTPAIFTLTPYIADSYHPRATYFAQRGYAFALVDCRGRGNSEGEFEPLVNEGRDGHDVAVWLAGQLWCNGAVTMWGGSYGGFDQWMTLKEGPAPLRTIVPAASVHPGEINCYQFDSFTFFSRRIVRGSRLRLLFDSPNSIYMQKNYNSGGVVAGESGQDARTAHVTLYHDPEHPSYLELPVVTSNTQ